MKKKVYVLLAFSLVLMCLMVTSDWQPGDGHKMHYPQLPDVLGWDVNATHPLVLADDWLCTETGPVTDIHFWGSWKHGINGTITAFNISIYEDIPADPPINNYSKPGTIVWNQTFYSWEMVPLGLDMNYSEGWYDPAKGIVIPNDHALYYQYNLVNISEPFIQQNGTIYWLSISAVLLDPSNTSWGWKSSIDHWNDDACWALIDELNWIDLWEPELEPITNEFWIEFGSSGEFINGGGTDYYGNGWYYYPNTDWWNIWFYDHPFDPDRYKNVTIYLEWYATGPFPWIEVALDWATDFWPPGGPPPIPPLDPIDEDMFIARVLIPLLDPGPQLFEYTIFDYNPEWVSIDVRGVDVIIPIGTITHECLPEDPPVSLDLSFVITGEQPCTPNITVEKDVWDDLNSDWTNYTDIDVGEIAHFKVAIHNTGTCCNLTNIIVYDFLEDSMEFLNAVPPPDIVTILPNGTEIIWTFSGPLPPCSWINVTLDALVLGPVCHTDFNCVNVTAYCPSAGVYVFDDDCAYVHATHPPTVDYILITWLTGVAIQDANISSNLTFTGYASSYNNTVGYIGLIPVNWSVANTGSNASTTPQIGLSSSFSSGWFNGTVVWTADDGNGHSDTVVFTINTTLFSSVLHQGWNLLTIPYMNGWSAETLGENITGCTIGIMFDGATQNFTTHVIGVPWDDFPIVDGIGYFVYVTVASIFSYLDEPVMNVNVTVHQNWNMIGWYHVYHTTAESLGENMTGCTLVLMFDAESQTFLTHVVGVPWDNFEIRRGMGLFIYATMGSYWHGEG